jgi:D-alanyl-D-alanine carboxypeptidase
MQMTRKTAAAIVAASLLWAGTAQAASVLSVFTSLVKANSLPLAKEVYCVANAAGPTDGYDEDVRVIPASISKLYTFDFALSTLGKDFRYTTDVYLSGTTLYINGGGDPHFVIENLRQIIKRVQSEQNVRISRFVFSPNFYFNWQKTPASVTWSMTASLKEDSGAPIDPDFSVSYSSKPYTGTGTHYRFQSAPLYILIKQINDYSTNISADVLFQRAGGASGFAAYMKKTYDATSSTVKFATGSGLSGNYTTCSLTLEVMAHLKQQADALGIGVENLMSVPRVDPGVLYDTLPLLATTSGIAAKSGFLDYHHNYAGIAQTSAGPLYFGVFGGYLRLADGPKTETFVETFISRLLSQYVQVPFRYAPTNDVPTAAAVTRMP